MFSIFPQNAISLLFRGASRTDLSGGRFSPPLLFGLILGCIIFSNDLSAAPPNTTPLPGTSLTYADACKQIRTIDGLYDALRAQYPTPEQHSPAPTAAGADDYLIPTTATAKLSFACADAGSSLRHQEMSLATFCADIDIDIPGGTGYRNPVSSRGCKKSVRWQLKNQFCQTYTSPQQSAYKDDVVYDCEASDYTIPDFNMVTLEVQLEPDVFDTRTFFYRAPDYTTQDTPILLNFHGSEAEDVLNIDAEGMPNRLLLNVAEKYLGAATNTSPNYIHVYLTTPSDYKNSSSCTGPCGNGTWLWHEGQPTHDYEYFEAAYKWLAYNLHLPDDATAFLSGHSSGGLFALQLVTGGPEGGSAFTPFLPQGLKAVSVSGATLVEDQIEVETLPPNLHLSIVSGEYDTSMWLCTKDLLSQADPGGKRGFRVKRSINECVIEKYKGNFRPQWDGWDLTNPRPSTLRNFATEMSCQPNIDWKNSSEGEFPLYGGSTPAGVDSPEYPKPDPVGEAPDYPAPETPCYYEWKFDCTHPTERSLHAVSPRGVGHNYNFEVNIALKHMNFKRFSQENRKQDPASYDPGEVQRILDPGNDGACQQ